MSPAPAQRIFISYRREDASGHAGRLYDALAARFGEDNVFMDVSLAPGLDFVTSIERAVGSCHVVLVVMGPRWATIAKADGRARLGLEDDYVRLEVETGLRRNDVTVIPVLVGGAAMPEPATLPPALRPLTRRNALEVSDGRWRYDAGRLLEAVRHALDEATVGYGTEGHAAVVEDPGHGPRPGESALVAFDQPSLLPATAAAAGVGAMAGVLGGLLAKWLIDAPAADDAAKLVHHVVWRSVTWAVVAGALAVLLAVRQRRPTLPVLLAGLAVGALAGLAGVVDWLAFNTTYVHGGIDKVLPWITLPLITTIVGGFLGADWSPRHVGLGLAAGLLAGGLGRFLFATVLPVHGGAAQVLILAPQAALLAALVWLACLSADAAPAASRPASARLA